MTKPIGTNGDFIINVGSNIEDVIKRFGEAKQMLSTMEGIADSLSRKVTGVPGIKEAFRSSNVSVPTGGTTMAGLDHIEASLRSAASSLKTIADKMLLGGAGVSARAGTGFINPRTGQESLSEFRGSGANMTPGQLGALEVARLRKVQDLSKQQGMSNIRESEMMSKESIRRLAQEQRRADAQNFAERKRAVKDWEMSMSGKFMTQPGQGPGGGSVLRSQIGNRPIDMAQVNQMNAAFNAKQNRPNMFETAFQRVAMFGGISLGIYKAVEAGTAFIGKMIEMDKQITDLRKTLAGTDADFEKLMGSAIGIARRYKASTTDVLDAMELFSRTFKRQGDLEELSKSAILFSNISGLGLKDSAETLTATLQQYNMSVSDAAKITDSWAAVAASTAITTKDLGDAVAVAGGAAKQAGLTFDEFNGMIATVASVTGKSGKEIGNAFTRIFERSTSDEGVKTLAKLKIGVKDAGGNFRDFSDILDDTNERWKVMTDTEKKQTAIAFAGARQYSVFLALMQNYSKAINNAAVSQNSLGAAQLQNDKIADSFQKKLKALGNEFDALAVSVGQGALPVFGGMVDMATKLLQIFGQLPGAIKAVSLALGGVGAAGGVLSALSPGARTAFRGIGAAARGGTFAAGAAGTGVAGVMAGIGTVALAFAALASVIYAVIKAYDILKNQIPDILKASGENTAKALQTATSLLQDRAKIQSVFTRDSRTGEIGFDKDAAQGIVKDIRLNNPQIIKDNNILFDRMGDAVGLNVEKLIQLQAALSDAAAQAENFALATAGANASRSSSEFQSNLRGGRAAWLLSAITERDQNPGVGTIENKLSRGGRNPGTALRGINRRLIEQRIDVNKEFTREDFESTRGIFEEQGLGLVGDPFSEAKTVMERIAEARAIQSENQANANIAFGRIFSSPTKPGEKESTAKKRRMADAVRFRDAQNQANTQGVQEQFRPLLEVRIPEQEVREKGPAGDLTQGGSGKLRGFRPRNFGRIDLELQKSLIDTGTNARNLGFNEVDVAAESLQSYKKAIIDLGTEIKKAADPAEDEAMLKRQEKINDLKEKVRFMSSKEGHSTKAQIDEVNRQIYAEEDLMEAVQKENEERLKGLEILRGQYYLIKEIVSSSNIIKGGLVSAITSLPASSRERILGRRQLVEDQAFANERLNRVLAGGQETASKRNEAKHIREEIDAINRSMDDLNKKTDIWGNLLQKIGDSYLSEIADKLVEGSVGSLTDILVDSISGDVKGKGLFGETNAQFDALGGGVIAIGGTVGAGAASSALNKKTFQEPTGRGAGGPSLAGFGSMDFGPSSTEQSIMARNQASASAKINWGAMAANAAQNAMLGAAIGQMMTGARGKEGDKGAIGGAIGGAVGGIVGGTLLSSVGGGYWLGPLLSMAGSAIGSAMDEDIKPLKKTLDELENTQDELTYTLQSLDKHINTLNDTMENIINAPANFMLPIPKGILENSVTAQSAIATPLQAGGLILKSGPAYLHAGETVMRKGGAGGSGGGNVITNSITIQGANKDPQAIADEVMNRIGSSLFYQSQREGNRSPRY